MLYWTDGELDVTFARRLGSRAEHLRTCVQCGSCTASCPTAISMSVSPQRLGRLIRLGMERETLKAGSYWQCTSCDACGLHCPRGISMMEVIVELKRYARRQGLNPPDEVRLLCQAVRDSKNISGDPNDDRLRWTTNLPQPLDGIDRVQDADLVYFVGCIASFYPRAFGIAQGFGRILNLAGLRFTTLGGDEWCCGYPLLHAGMHDEVGALVEHNLARVRDLGLKTLVTTCASCFYTWKVLYPRFASLPTGVNILHSSQLLAELVQGGRLRPARVAGSVTYHDPCDLARKCGELEAPRYVLGSLLSEELREMANTGMNTLCCGGGGDVKLLDVDTTLDVARRRVEQAVDVEADTVVSACQQCKRALVGAVQWMRKPIKVVDIVELVWMSLADEVQW